MSVKLASFFSLPLRRMLKRPPLFLKQIKQKPSRPPKRRHTIGGVGLGTAESERELLKEQFQLAITEECALETAELDTPRGKRADNKKTEKVREGTRPTRWPHSLISPITHNMYCITLEVSRVCVCVCASVCVNTLWKLRSCCLHYIR